MAGITVRFISPILLLALLTLGALLPGGLAAQETTSRAAAMELQDQLPLDPAITTGKLKNGITYYIRKNAWPEKRAELRLVVKAGSVLERPEQQGLAHFVEHMAFNGTKNFKKHELVDFLESIGMRFGADLNAYTSFDETVYMLQLPTGDPKIVDKGFQILEDWAHNISFEAEEIEKERGVIVEEWRLRRGAEARMNDRQFPILLQGSRYGERLPIGKMDVIDTFKHETLRKFYEEWYRPDMMAVIAVGDFDASDIEKMIKTHFNRILPSQNPPSREAVTIPDHDATLFAIASDPEATRSGVSIYYKHPYEPTRTVADYRDDLVEDLYNAMLSQRLYELSRRPDAPFLFGYSSSSGFGTTKHFHVLGAGVANNGIQGGLEALLTEAERARLHGFTQPELDRTRQEMIRGMEQAYMEQSKTESARYADEYAALFLEDVPAPGIGYELELYRKYLPQVALEQVNALAGRLVTDRNRVVMVNMPQADGVRQIGEKELRMTLNAVAGRQIEPYVDQVADQPLLEKIPTPGKITSERTVPELGVTEWTLSNGVRLVVKPTDFKNDEVMVHAFSHGGTSLASDADYISATTAPAVMQEGGLGKVDRVTLQKLLTGKVVQVSPYINELQEGVNAYASPQDLETLFQLIYLTFTAPRVDSAAFLSYRTRMKSLLQNRSAQPETAFGDTLQVTLSQYHARRRPATAARFDSIDLGRAHSFYRDRFADAGDFTFVIVGSITPEQLRPLVETYLGGLPSQGKNERWRDVGVRAPEGVVRKEVRKGVEPKSLVRLVFHGALDANMENRHLLRSMMSALEYRLREELREEKGGTYGVGAAASVQRHPIEQYSLVLTFGCAPDRVEEMIAATMGVIEQFKRNGPLPADMEKLKETQRRELEVSLKENSYWAAMLQSRYMYGEDPRSILREGPLTEALTAERLRDAARKYFDTNRYVQVAMYPEK